jgi:hypothetical protein
MQNKMSAPTKMLSSAVEWLHDWMEGYETPPILLDEFHLEEWMQNDMLEATECFLMHAFRKQKTRAVALDILRALFWEIYLFQREAAIAHLPVQTGVVTRLLSLPQTAQKTAAWYAEARELLTGHEFATVVHGKGKAWEDVIARKCVPETMLEDEDTTMESRTVYITPLTPFQWGWRYESVIRDLFELLIAGGKVVDTLGRIRHPTLPRLAASPDGLIVDGPKAGRLVEIKAPISRTLTGVIPDDYYCQMQLQAEVTDVEAVEYIEVRFGTRDQYASDMEFLNSEGIKKEAFQKMGSVLIVGDQEQVETWKYEYSPILELLEENLVVCKTWIPEGILESQILERSIWRIKDICHTTVPRNREWWDSVGFPAYQRFWIEVEEARAEGRFKSKLLLVDSEEEE